MSITTDRKRIKDAAKSSRTRRKFESVNLPPDPDGASLQSRVKAAVQEMGHYIVGSNTGEDEHGHPAIDVYGWLKGTPEGEQEWSIQVTA